MAWTDPRDIVKCACPRIDGHGCYRTRNHVDDIDNYDVSDGPCECRCHEIYDEQSDDEDVRP